MEEYEIDGWDRRKPSVFAPTLVLKHLYVLKIYNSKKEGRYIRIKT